MDPLDLALQAEAIYYTGKAISRDYPKIKNLFVQGKMPNLKKRRTVPPSSTKAPMYQAHHNPPDELAKAKTITPLYTRPIGRDVGENPWKKKSRKTSYFIEGTLASANNILENGQIDDKKLYKWKLIKVVGTNLTEESQPYKRTRRKMHITGIKLNGWMVPKNIQTSSWTKPVVVRLAVCYSKAEGGVLNDENWFKHSGDVSAFGGDLSDTEAFPPLAGLDRHWLYAQKLDREDKVVLWDKTFVIGFNTAHSTGVTKAPLSMYRNFSKFIPINRLLDFASDTNPDPTQNIYLCCWCWQLGDSTTDQQFTTNRPFDLSVRATTYFKDPPMYR